MTAAHALFGLALGALQERTQTLSRTMRRGAGLWSGCVAGVYREDAFCDTFDHAGFYGMKVIKRDERPWRTVGGVEFRSVSRIVSPARDEGHGL